MSATQQQIVEHFLRMPDHYGNWGTSIDNSKWNITGATESYINGIMLTVDMDYLMGWLIEVGDRTDDKTGVRWFAIFQAYGNPPDGSLPIHDSRQFECEPQTFFERTVTQRQVEHWAIDAVDEMVLAHSNREKAEDAEEAESDG